MLNEFSRTELLLGKDAMQRLYHARVAVFGIGGVGGYVVEALARSGVGAFDLIDEGLSDEYQPPDHRYPSDDRQIQSRCHGGADSSDQS